MKHIKLFESFDSLKPEDILKDIKTVSYIMEDDGYDIKYFYNVTQPFSGTRNVNSDELEGYIEMGHYSRSKIEWNEIKIHIYPESGSDLDKMKVDGDNFMRLLKEHLDYITSNKITSWVPKHIYVITIKL